MAPKKRLVAAIAALGTSMLAACGELGSIPNPLSMSSGIIHVEPHAKDGNSQVLRSGRPVVLLLADIKDERGWAPTRKIGEVSATVIDMAGTSLTLDQDVSAALSTALRRQLAADGFRVVDDPHAPHDFEVGVVAKEFRLDIVARDELNIAANIALLDAGSHEVLWSGDVTEKSSRFAGVAGDSRASIANTLSKGLSTWAGKVSGSVRDGLLKSYPQTISVGERKDSVAARLPGVTILQEAKPREEASASPAPTIVPLTAQPTAPADNGAVGRGTFLLSTSPAKAQVYIGDVYFGMSPLKLELEPGVVSFRFKLDGYKTVEQKVSIRRGETTELDVKFEK